MEAKEPKTNSTIIGAWTAAPEDLCFEDEAEDDLPEVEDESEEVAVPEVVPEPETVPETTETPSLPAADRAEVQAEAVVALELTEAEPLKSQAEESLPWDS